MIVTQLLIPHMEGTLLQRRQQAVTLRLSGSSARSVAETCGMSRVAVNRLIKRFRAGGWEAVEALGDGPLPGKVRRLTNEQEQTVLSVVHHHPPDEAGLHARLWDKETLSDAIAERTGIRLHDSTLAAYQRRWGFRAAKVYRKTVAQDPMFMRRWMKHEYPGIMEQVRAYRGQVHWVDVGPLPNMRDTTDASEAFWIISSNTNRGRLRWMVGQGPLDAVRLTDFLQRSIDSDPYRIAVIMEHTPVLDGPMVQEWCRIHADRLDIFPLGGTEPSEVAM